MSDDALYQSHQSAFTALVTYFPRVLPPVTNACRNRNALYRCYIFVAPIVALVTSFPAFVTRCMFSRTCYLCHVFPRLFPVKCFPACFSGFNLTSVYVVYIAAMIIHVFISFFAVVSHIFICSLVPFLKELLHLRSGFSLTQSLSKLLVYLLPSFLPYRRKQNIEWTCVIFRLL